MSLFDNVTEVGKVKSKLKLDAIANKSTIRKNEKMICRNDNAEKIIEQAGGLPEEGEMMSFVSNGLSDAGSFFSVILKKFTTIDEIYIATWTISKQNILRILEPYDQGKIKKVGLLISSGLLLTNSTKPIWAFLSDEFGKRNIPLRAIETHAKIYTIKSGENYITVCGSGNWSENPRVENYILVGSKEMFNFNKEWINKQINI